MTVTYTFDVYSSLDGFASYDNADWGPYWGKQGPEFLERRVAMYREPQRMVFGASTFRQFVEMIGPSKVPSLDPELELMRNMPTTVLSSTLDGPFDWPDATVATGDAVERIARLKEESDVPLRSHGSLSLNRALMAAGLVDRVQVTIFPVIAGQTGVEPVFENAADFDLELLEAHTFDGRTQELVYRPVLHS
ncbi:dihydrofolate reductase family protein [Kribbella sp. WER1]